MTEKQRIEIPLEANEYSFFKYITYVLYSPLYLAGPVLTFNDFWRQVSIPLDFILFFFFESCIDIF